MCIYFILGFISSTEELRLTPNTLQDNQGLDCTLSDPLLVRARSNRQKQLHESGSTSSTDFDEAAVRTIQRLAPKLLFNSDRNTKTTSSTDLVVQPILVCSIRQKAGNRL